MYLKKIANKLFITFFIFTAVAADASVSFNVEVELFNTTAGAGNPAPTTTLWALIADTTGDGFGFLSDSDPLTVGSLLNTDDKILHRGDLSLNGTDGFLFNDPTGALTLDSTTANTTAGTWAPGDPLAVLWFPSLTLADTAYDASSYGILTFGTDGSSAFTTPSDSTSLYLLRYIGSDTNLGGPNTSAITGSAGSGTPTQAVPEPTTLLLFGLAGLVGVVFRRRH